LNAALGLHGLAQYFFETDAYLYFGQDSRVAFSLETERDLLLTQKLILKPYLDLNVVFSDDSRYAQKTGLNSIKTGLETRYEITKKVMPYVSVAYAYSKGNKETAWQTATDSESGWLYGAGLRFRF
jgi:copper resistance protein B